MERQVPVPGIVIYKNVFNDPIKIINDIEDNFGTMFTDAMVYEGAGDAKLNKSSRDCSTLGLNDDFLKHGQEKQIETYKSFRDPMLECVKDYGSIYGVGFDALSMDSWGVLRYGIGQKFDAHIDDGPRYPRLISMTAYLNNDYTGGEIEYSHFGFTYKPEPGDVLVFPSNYVYNHRVVPVETGIRYAIVQWFRWNTIPVEIVR